MQVKIQLCDLIHLLWQHIVDANIRVSVDRRSLGARVELPGDGELGSSLGCISLVDQRCDLSQDATLVRPREKV